VRSFARAHDKLTLLELHPAEIDNLRVNLAGDARVAIHHRDGYSGVLALSPPEPRRGFALMDPSYETADDYEKTAETLIALHRRWPVGILALWYPIVARREAELAGLKDRFATSGIEGILTAELLVKKPQQAENGPDEPGDPGETDGLRESAGGFGLLGSGMLIVSPPWKLEEELSSILPWLAECFGENDQGSSVLEWLSLPR
jgi:23S rRNA (adenine2030-N6)-methyltransferase